MELQICPKRETIPKFLDRKKWLFFRIYAFSIAPVAFLSLWYNLENKLK